jgi:hypothetical protein
VGEPTRRIVFCEGWHAGSPRYRHAALWARGQVGLQLTTRQPVRVTLSANGRPVRALRVTAPASVRVGHAGWWLIGLDVTRADRGLRVTVRPSTR